MSSATGATCSRPVSEVLSVGSESRSTFLNVPDRLGSEELETGFHNPRYQSLNHFHQEQLISI